MRFKTNIFVFIIILLISSIAAILFGDQLLLFNDSSNFFVKDRAIAQTQKTYSNLDFPLGWYDYITLPKIPTKMAAENMNIVMPYIEEGGDDLVQTYLDAAQTSDMKVLVELRRSLVESGNTKAIIEFIRKFENHPAVYGWYLYDEPELKQLSPAMLKRLYRAIKAEDSSKPVVAALLSTSNNINKYQSISDILMFDYYPCLAKNQEFEGFEGLGFRDIVRANQRQTKGKEGFWFAIQGSGEKENGKKDPGTRLPTAKEQKYMVYSTVLGGVNGILFWMHYFSQQSWIDSVLTPIAKEFQSYIPTIKTGKLPSKVRVDRADVEAGLYKDPINRGYLLMVAHHGRGTVNARIKIFDMSVKSVFSGEENRSIRLSERSFQDNFSDYAVRIYRVR